MFFVRSIFILAAVGAFTFLVSAVPAIAPPLPKTKGVEPIRPKLTATEKREESLSRARAQVHALLQEQNACSAWFHESVEDPTAIFDSLQFKFESIDRPFILRASSNLENARDLYKHPWAARARQFAGPNSTVVINLDGPFFSQSSQVVELAPGGGVIRYLGFRMLTIGPFKGSTSEAQITTLLHELGHITDRIPADEDSWDGKSSRNTEEVLHHCKPEIREFAKRNIEEHE